MSVPSSPSPTGPSFFDRLESAASENLATVESKVTQAATHPLDTARAVVNAARAAAAPAADPSTLTTVDQKVNAINRLIGGASGVVGTLRSAIPGNKGLGDQVLDILKTCKSAGEMDAVISQVGRRPMLLGLHLHGASADGVKDFIEKTRAADAHPGDWDGMDRYLDQVTGTQVRSGNQVTLLNNGEKAFPEIWGSIDQAKESVNVETYEFHNDSTGQEYAKHLIDAAKRGVTVNVMMDAHGSDKFGGQQIAAQLRAGGVNVIENQTDLTVSKIDHRKVVVCDGKTGFTGGMNIGDDYHGVGDTPWHDMHSKIEGPAVGDMQKAFLTRWRTEGGRVPSNVNYFPPPQQAGDEQVRVIPHTGGQDENIRLTYLRAIDTAETSVMIEDPYFVDGEVMEHLKQAAQRGVNVQCVWPAHNDEEEEQTDARRWMPDLIAAGVKCYEYDGRAMAHEKVCCIDGKFATIGSSNLDARSLRNNHELNIAVRDPKFAGDLQQQIQDDITHSTPMTRLTPSLREEFEQPLLGLQALEDEI